MYSSRGCGCNNCIDVLITKRFTYITTYPPPSRQSEYTCNIYPPPVRVPPDSSPPPVLVRVQYFVTLFWISRSRDTPSRDTVGLSNFHATRRRKIVPNSKKTKSGKFWLGSFWTICRLFRKNLLRSKKKRKKVQKNSECAPPLFTCSAVILLVF